MCCNESSPRPQNIQGRTSAWIRLLVIQPPRKVSSKENPTCEPSELAIEKNCKKSTIVGSKFSPKLISQAKYRQFGIQAKIGIAAKDPGIGRTGGARRTMTGIKNRFGKAKTRANRVAYLSRKNKRTKALYGTG